MRPMAVACRSHGCLRSPAQRGTGRTVALVATALVLADRGYRVLLVDDNATPTLTLLTKRDGEPEITDRVHLAPADWSPERTPEEFDCVLVDAFGLLERSTFERFTTCDGLLLTTLADPLAAKTLDGSTESLVRQWADAAKVELLGVAVTAFREEDPVQAESLQRLRSQLGALLVEPPLPWIDELTTLGMHRSVRLPASAMALLDPWVDHVERWLRAGDEPAVAATLVDAVRAESDAASEESAWIER